MIRKSSPARSRNLKILLGVTLGIAVALTLVLLLVPEKEARSLETRGVVLFEDGEARPCEVSLQGAMNTYAFEQDAPVYVGTLLLDGHSVGEVRLTFDGDCAAPNSGGLSAVLTKDLALAAEVTLDGRDGLVLAPAADEAEAQALLARFLADTAFARRQGWEAYGK